MKNCIKNFINLEKIYKIDLKIKDKFEKLRQIGRD